MSKLDFKTLVFSGALALGAQNVLASASLPCPKDSPINDTIGVLQSDIKNNVQNRLMQIDREKFHQVVVITVNSPADYGYDSLAHMGADTINKCGIGYRGENTGTIVWFSNNFDSDKNKYFISTASGVSGYITDNLARRLVASSKETCDKANVSCRMDDITKGLDAIITKHLAGKNQVQVIHEGINAHDEKISSESIENILQLLGLGGLVILVVGGGIKIQNNLTASRKRKELKKKILEVAIKFEQEKTKYPEWFINSHMLRDEKTLKNLQNISDPELEYICKSLSKLNQLQNISLGTIRNNITAYAGEYQQIVNGVLKTKQDLEDKINQVKGLYTQLEKEGFPFQKISLAIPYEQSNPELTLKAYSQSLSFLLDHIGEISQIPQIYRSLQGFDEKLSNELSSAKSEFEKIRTKYEGIYGKSSTPFSFSNFETKVLSLISSFQTANEKKDAELLQELKRVSENIFTSFQKDISLMNAQISWYEELPKEISSLEAKLKKMNPSPEYEKNAKAFREESGKRKFDNYDMGGVIAMLQMKLQTIKTNFAQKTNFGEIQSNISQVKTELYIMQEYIGLGAIVATLIAQRVAEEQRQAREAERQAREAAAEAERERKREDDSRNSWSSSSSSDSGGWSSGGGGGGDGGGGGGD